MRLRPSAVWLSAACASLIGGCAHQTVQLQGNRIFLPPGRDSDVRLPVASMLERRFARVYRQQFDFSCGAAALATLLTFHYGDQQSEQSVFVGMWSIGDQTQIRKVGFSLLEMKRYLAAQGIRSDGFRVTLQDIQKARIPGIALINVEHYRHFVVVKGLDSRSVLIGDPSLGARRLSRREFLDIWNGIYFALEAGHHGAFDAPLDAAFAPAAVAPLDAEPLDLQMLSLLRPNLPLGVL